MLYPHTNFKKSWCGGILLRMAKNDVSKQALALHKKLGGKIRIVPAAPVKK